MFHLNIICLYLFAVNYYIGTTRYILEYFLNRSTFWLKCRLNLNDVLVRVGGAVFVVVGQHLCQQLHVDVHLLQRV